MVYNLINIKTIRNIINILFIILILYVLLHSNNTYVMPIKFNSADSVMQDFYP